MKNVFRPTLMEAPVGRREELQYDGPRRWGRMTPRQAEWRLSDSLEAILGDRPIPPRLPGLRRRLARFAAFTLPVPWLEGVPTSSRVNPPGGGHPDRRLRRRRGGAPCPVGPAGGHRGPGPGPPLPLGRPGWGEWGRHAHPPLDHHLSQLGV
ncbi:MAG: hypothetical protein GWM92_03490 [Gemmatimonadetes bacterium]|nr:hypothetical protein [Gemmatimonadota bacterium]NIR77580.1 hypothetical protein [Gemmatimonadota bacterium]NIT86132.1 hypothetical protein [Gemmatimonadota bacterium]NIU29949.1 hypothetical protein [Gemmatimonadota bacterium]NIU34918.1 hypothetical protein [Gemmatimonadota bacterium]